MKIKAGNRNSPMGSDQCSILSPAEPSNGGFGKMKRLTGLEIPTPALPLSLNSVLSVLNRHARR